MSENKDELAVSERLRRYRDLNLYNFLAPHHYTTASQPTAYGLATMVGGIMQSLCIAVIPSWPSGGYENATRKIWSRSAKTEIMHKERKKNTQRDFWLCSLLLCLLCIQRFDAVGLFGWKGIRPVKPKWWGCWHGYLSGARCRLAYGPADATATHCLLLQ